MKRLTTMMAVLALALGMARCRKPDVQEAVTPSGTVSMTVTASPGRTAIDSADGTVVWSDGDKMYVSVNDGDTWKCKGSLTLSTGAGTATGTFTGTLAGVPTGEQEFKFFYLGSGNGVSVGTDATTVQISFAEQNVTADGRGNITNADRYHVGYGEAVGTVSGSSVSGINVTLTSKVAIAYLDFIDGETPYAGALTLSGTEVYNSMTVNFDGHFTGQQTGEGKISLTNTTSSKKYVMLVPKGAGAETIEVGGGAEGSVVFYNGIVENKIYRMSDGSPIEVPVMVKPSNETNGIASEFEQGEFFSDARLPGEFTVNASGDKVNFSRGNMYYDGKFRIEENQWMTTPSAEGLNLLLEELEEFDDILDIIPVAAWSESHVSHFYWSKDESEAVKEVFDETQDMSKNDVFFTNATPVTPNPDFMANGEKGVWRNLSSAEMNYILNLDGTPDGGRQDAARFAIAKVHDVNGLLLFPDGYPVPTEPVEGMSEINEVVDPNGFPANSIEDATWIEMENDGVVFLPTGGGRNLEIPGISSAESLVFAMGVVAAYWLSDCDEDGRSKYFAMFYSIVSDGDLIPIYRDGGGTVRLVRAVN